VFGQLFETGMKPKELASLLVLMVLTIALVAVAKTRVSKEPGIQRSVTTPLR
jgi:hypothetical protein